MHSHVDMMIKVHYQRLSVHRASLAFSRNYMKTFVVCFFVLILCFEAFEIFCLSRTNLSYFCAFFLTLNFTLNVATESN